MADTAALDSALVDLGFGPDERVGVFIVGLDEGVDVLAKLGDGVEGRTTQRLPFEDREPDLDLVEPRGPRVGVKWNCTLG